MQGCFRSSFHTGGLAPLYTTQAFSQADYRTKGMACLGSHLQCAAGWGAYVPRQKEVPRLAQRRAVWPFCLVLWYGNKVLEAHLLQSPCTAVSCFVC